MLVPIFTLKIKHKIHPRMVTVGKYDGLHPCLSCGTTAQKVFVHNPHSPAISGGRIAVQDSDISLLSLNQSVTSVCAGHLDQSHNRDTLCIGTQTNLLAYDVHNNTDLFYKEVPDGVNNLVIGNIRNVEERVVVAGGNCTLQGFNAEGDDKFWTVTGDVVCSLALTDFTNDGIDELLVGSEDYDIRVFKGDEIISEISETEAVTGLCRVQGSRFGYSLANGSVGCYDRATRYWRIKSKNQVMSIHSFDLDGDGVPELITGWSNGKIDVRSNATGEVIFKDNMSSAVAGMVDADYRMDGTDQLVCCSVDGEIRGYKTDETRQHSVSGNRDADTTRDLNMLKQKLLLELSNYEKGGVLKAEDLSAAEKVEGGVIPLGTKLNTSILIQPEPDPHIELSVCTNNETIVRMVVIFAEGLFAGESHVVHPSPNQLSNHLRIPLYPPRDAQVTLFIQAFISIPGSPSFHIFEVEKQLPCFASYMRINSLPSIPDSHVTFSINERLQRVAIWLSENFLIHQEVECEENINVMFLMLRGGGLGISMEQSGKVTIRTDNIDVAGELIQSLAKFLSLDNLQSTAHFPMHLEKLGEIMSTVDSLHSVTQKLAAEMTDHSNLIKSLVVRTEDARLQDNIGNMKKGYMELKELNSELVTGYQVRSTNHQDLVSSLKLVNQIIQKAAQLRVGRYHALVVSQCREAIKANRVAAMFKIIQAGSA